MLSRGEIDRYARFLSLAVAMKSFAVTNPATSAVLDVAPDHGVEGARAAVERSVAAFPSWKAKTAFERSQILRKWYDAILDQEFPPV